MVLVLEIEPFLLGHTSVLLYLLDVPSADHPVVTTPDVASQGSIFLQVKNHLLVIFLLIVFSLIEVSHCRNHILRVIFTLAERSLGQHCDVLLRLRRVSLKIFIRCLPRFSLPIAR